LSGASTAFSAGLSVGELPSSWHDGKIRNAAACECAPYAARSYVILDGYDIFASRVGRLQDLATRGIRSTI
jgi:hypothetical protein